MNTIRRDRGCLKQETYKQCSAWKAIALTASVAMLLAACGGGSSSSSTSNSTMSGKLMDGYISGAKVCLDLNDNGICDSTDPSATTSTNGSYSLSYPSNTALGSKHLVAEIPAGAIDSDAPGVPLTQPLRMLAPASTPGVVTPLTTMVSKYMKEGQALATAQSLTRTALSLPAGHDFSSDYIAANNSSGHNVARLVAAMLKGSVGGNPPTLANLNAALTVATNHAPAAYAASDVTSTITLADADLQAVINPTPTPTPKPAPATNASFTFDNPSVTYTLTDFGGNQGSIVADPAGGTALVGMVVKTAAAATWAGTTVSTGLNQSLATISLAPGMMHMTLQVWAPAVGVPVRLKLENALDNTQTVETEALTTAANAWQMLTFDFTSPATGTAAFSPTTTYNKASVFFNFGAAGVGGTADTYYFDDLTLVAGGVVPPTPVAFSTVTFDDAAKTYTLTDFGGNAGSLVADPAGGANQVAQIIKTAASQTWAGTTVSTGANASVGTIPLTASALNMSLRVWSPAVGAPIRLKLEDAANGANTLEAEALTTVVNAWEVLTFNFATPASGTAAFNVGFTYNKASVFFNFGTAGTGETYYFDDLTFVGAGVTPPQPPVTAFSAVTFDDVAKTYTLTDFGGNAGSIVVDPVTGTGNVAMVVKTAAAATWAGTTVSTGANLSVGVIPLATGAMTMSLRVWAPAVGLPVRLKVENAANNTQTIETEAVTTVANGWQTLTFNFASPATGTAAFSATSTYDKASVFFNFGAAGVGGVADTYYFDDLM